MIALTFSKEGADIYAAIDCKEPVPLLDEKDVSEAFKASEFSSAFLIFEELSSFIEKGNEFIELAEKDPASLPDGDTRFGHRIAEYRDAKLKVIVDKDKMSAKLHLESAFGGEQPSVDDVKEACRKAGVRFGIKRSRVEGLLEKTFDASPGEVFEARIAFGKEPKDGKNAYFKPLVELFSEKLRAPTEKEGGKVDLRDLGDIDTVKPGQQIFQKFPLTEGVPGMNVLGEELPPTPGKDLILEETQGTVIDPNNPDVLLAKREGLARVIENRMEVDNVYSLPELTPKQGHVKFNGSVIISGDVSPEMKIIATGDVVVGGFVESALIRCQGEITIMGGASGKLLEPEVEGRQYNCLLESGYRINIAFANQIDIRAKRDVFAHKQLSHCNIIAASLKVGQGTTPNGKLIGGTLMLSKHLEVGHLGAPAGADTHVSLNRTYKIFRQKEDAMWAKIQPYNEDLEALKEKGKMLMSDAQKAEYKAKLLKLEKIVGRLQEQRKKLIQRRRDYLDALSVVVHHTLYAGTTVEIGDKSKINDRQRGPSIIRLNEFVLEIEPKG
ncbi:DUF342 domain-containing protein [Psychrosphaera ytuae]|uniref:DUF342 domain-containing protein n=1 Tax=Psychrosphaera ytuae TaxID=2820710 RepID=A0A975DA96_9GAMM|nr:FapA family protein [Psychrosphaera ytuae]QTH63069.1 DUF342 domain-containing protein [Psychrosphaera ytuae]